MFSYILHWGYSITFLCAFSGTFPSTDTFCCGRHTRRGWRNNQRRITWIFAMCILGSRDPLGWGGRGYQCRCQPAKKKYNQLSTCICWICLVFLSVVVLYPSRVFHSNQDVIIADKMLQNFGQWPLRRKGFLIWQKPQKDLSFSPIISEGIDGLKSRVLG